MLEPGRTERNYWGDLWRYRELFAMLAWRDLAVRYKQTVIGVAWAVVRPLLTTLIFTLAATKVAHLQSDGDAPYALMVFAGVMPWTLFASILSDASASLVMNANLVSKVYFPRVIVPTATVVVALVDLAVTLVLFFGLMAIFGYAPDWRIVFLPVFVMLAMLVSLGPALLLTALNVKYRDFRYIIPFIVQFGVYVSPVMFSSSKVGPAWRLLYSANPVVGVIDGFRWCLLRGQTELYWPGLGLGAAVMVLMLALGLGYFRATERSFADLV
ncbi:MAG TPA: ABC transporter permease [Caulobacteraceae bacterium]|nr:ABC transporter permease [Caulobacteraceae bacterium]